MGHLAVRKIERMDKRWVFQVKGELIVEDGGEEHVHRLSGRSPHRRKSRKCRREKAEGQEALRPRAQRQR